MRIIVIPVDSEVANFQNELQELGSVANAIGWVCIYFSIVLIFGFILESLELNKQISAI